MYVYIHIHVHIYIYIYIEREREIYTINNVYMCSFALRSPSVHNLVRSETRADKTAKANYTR